MGSRRSVRWFFGAIFVSLAGCGGGGSNAGTGPNNPPPPPPPPPAGSIQLAVGPPSSTIPQGGQVQLAVTVARVNFTGTVTTTLSGAPTGVTATITQPTGSGAVVTGTMLLVAAAATAPGTYTLTIQASGTGVTSVSQTVSLTITAVGSYTITGATGATLAPGGTTLVLLGVLRNNFTAPITLVADSLPAGVTASFSINPVVFDASSINISAAANVPLGSYRMSIRGTAAGFPDRSVSMPLTIAALGGFTLSTNPSPVNLQQGASQAVTININRTGGFGGIVLLQVEGAPTGLTVSLNPAATAAGTSTLTLTASAALAAGNYTLTIRGQSAGVASQSVTLPVQVTASTGGSGNVILDFSACVGFDVPAWVGWQDGNGAWATVTGTGRVYRFTVTAATASFAFVQPGPTTGASIMVQHMSRAEMTAAPFVYCSGAGPALKIVNGSVTSVTGNETVNISLGGGISFASASIPTFSIAGVQNGAHDLIAWRHDLIGDITGGGSLDRGFVRRDQDLPNGTSVGALNMTGPESFGPSSAVMTVSGIAAGEELAHTMRYGTGASCLPAMLYSSVRMSGNNFTAYGFSAQVQRPTDYHQLTFTTTTRQGGVLFPVANRSLTVTFRGMASRILTLGAPLTVPAPTTLAGNYKRLQAQFTMAAEYNSAASFTMTTTNKTVTIIATPAWIGGSNVTLSLPNFSGLPGWNDTWPPASGATGQWTATVAGSTLTAPSLCVENGRVVTAMRAGSF